MVVRWWLLLVVVVVLVAGCDLTAAPVQTRIRNAYVERSGDTYGSTLIVEGEAPPYAPCQVLTAVERSAPPGGDQSPPPDAWQTAAVADGDGWVRVEQSIVGAQQAANPYVLVRLHCEPGGDSHVVGLRVR